MQVTAKHLGALYGLGLGWLIIQYGIVKAGFVVGVTVLGWMVGRILDGEVDVSSYIRRREDLE